MKILMVTNLYPPNSIGGYERLCATLANALATRGHTVEVLTSAHGGGRSGDEPIPVDRRLRLLASSRSIYEPFEGGREERDTIIQANQAVTEEVVERFRPETVLAGNLMFLDRRFLEGLARLGVPLAYLLTDVWLAQMLDDVWLQQYFRREVLMPGGEDATGVDELIADVFSGSRVPVPVAEEERRTEIESRLAGARDAFQLNGVCHLCGRTVFLVRRPTSGSVVLPGTFRTSVLCGRCGLDGTVRAVVHAADSLVGERGSSRVAIVCPDSRIARVLERIHRGRVVERPEQLDAVGGPEVIADLTGLESAGGKSRSLKTPLRSDRQTVFPHARADGGDGDHVALFQIWSARYGYLGDDYRVGLKSAG